MVYLIPIYFKITIYRGEKIPWPSWDFMEMSTKTLVLGYGNSGRQDDGLGPAAAAAIDRLNLPGVKVEINYLLNIEDAADAAQHDVVLFIDALAEGPEPFEWREIFPADETAFSSHIVKPEVILGICQKCYGRSPKAWLLGIRGYQFELQEGLTERARKNLDEAIAYLQKMIW
jgi:hydrogenase maturation protease